MIPVAQTSDPTSISIPADLQRAIEAMLGPAIERAIERVNANAALPLLESICIYDLIDTGQLEAVKLGRLRRVVVTSTLQLVQKLRATQD
jgi:hypothetical protein